MWLGPLCAPAPGPWATALNFPRAEPEPGALLPHWESDPLAEPLVRSAGHWVSSTAMAHARTSQPARTPPPPPPPCGIPSGCCSFTGPRTVTRSSLCVLRRVAAFCRPLRPVLLLVSFPRSRSPVIGMLGLCWMWRDVWRDVVGVLGVVLVVAEVV